MALGGTQTNGGVEVVAPPEDSGLITLQASAEPAPPLPAATAPFPVLDLLTFLLLLVVVAINLYLTALIKNRGSRSFEVGLSRMQRPDLAVTAPQEQDAIRQMLQELRAQLDRIEQRLPPPRTNPEAATGPRTEPARTPSPFPREAAPPARVERPVSQGVNSALERQGRAIEAMPHNSPEIDQLARSGRLHFFFVNQAGELRLLGMDEWVRDKQWLFGLKDEESGQYLLFFYRGLANQKLNIQHDPAGYSRRMGAAFDIEINQSGVPELISPALVSLNDGRVTVLRKGRGSF